MHSCDILNLNFCKMFSFHYWLYHLLLCGHFIMGIRNNVPEKILKQCWKDPSNTYLDPARKVESNLGKILWKKETTSGEWRKKKVFVFIFITYWFKHSHFYGGSGCFHDFLFILTFNPLTTVCLGVDLFVFTLIWVFWASWVCR